MRPRILLLLLMSLVIASCGQNGVIQGTEPTANLGNKLVDTRWSLVQIQSMDDGVYRAQKTGRYTLSFTGEGRLVVQADCNAGRGSWTYSPPSGLELGPIAATRMFCGEGSIEHRFLRDLSHVRSVVMRDGRLYLATFADGSVLEFLPLDAERVQPSFDCARARGSVQELVCSDSALARLDLRMDELYRKALNQFESSEIPSLKAMQRGWIKGRDDCWKAQALPECVRTEYEQRITELEVKTGDVLVPAAVNYACDDGRRLAAYFYNNTRLPSLILNDGQDQMLLYRQVSGSGARFSGRNVEFWDKGTQARYSRTQGGMLQCEAF